MTKNDKKVTSIILVILSIISLIVISGLISFACPFEKYFHIYCPGCGSTRMFQSLLKLEIYQAFRFNPLLFIFLIALFIYIIFEIVYYIKQRKFFKISNKILVILLIIVLIYWILRNIPYFDWLAPTIIK